MKTIATKILIVIAVLILPYFSSSQTVHLIVFADTEDSQLGEGCKRTIRYFDNDFAPRIDRYTDMTVRKYINYGSSFNRSRLYSVIRGINSGSDDVIIFYFDGHGFNRTGQFPTIVLGKNTEPFSSRQIDLTEVFDILSDKSHRLLIVIGESCNGVRNSSNLSRTVAIKQNTSDPDGQQYKQLFEQAGGRYIVSSSEKGQFTYKISDNVGYFLNSFQNAFNEITCTSYSGSADWNTLFDNTKNKTRSLASSDGSTQVPQYENSGNYLSLLKGYQLCSTPFCTEIAEEGLYLGLVKCNRCKIRLKAFDIVGLNHCINCLGSLSRKGRLNRITCPNNCDSDYYKIFTPVE